MSIGAGTKLGRYEIRSLIGAGGMGEVYRAYDARINRDVAIKVLPAAFSKDKDRLARFEQEAQAAGALNHPNILAIYDVDTHDGAPYVVSELLEGETLRAATGGTALSVRRATDYALQIAHGLAAAHEKGIVHRDLKPENVFITKDGRVKILDFGLAKLTQPDGNQAQTEIPTRRMDTEPGMVMGTIGYMSPEQVRGRPVDHRSDIFSFGTILYEMLSGRRAFQGESVADTMSAILREDPPDLSETNKNIVPALSRVINHCLEKNPEQRFHSARDLAFAIEALSGSTVTSSSTGIAEQAAPQRRFNRELLAWIAAGIFLIAAGTLAALYFLRQPNADQQPVRFAVAMPEKATDITAPVVSPDGRAIAFLGTSEGKRYLYVRPLDSMTPQRLAGTDDAVFPFWSPDSRYIAFFSNNKLKKIEASGGPPQSLCDAQSPGGGTWNRDGVILFASLRNKVIHRVSAAGGETAPVTTLDESRKEVEQMYPVFLPNGQHFLYYAWNNNASESAIYVASVDGKERKLLLKNDSNAAYMSPGYLLFARRSTLMAQPFDTSKLELTGEPFPVLENVTYSTGISYSNFSVSDNGVMVYWSGATTSRQLAWFDRAGKQIATVGPPGEYNDIVLSPDEKRAAMQRVEGGSSDIWLMDLVRGVPSRFTFNPSEDDDPSWSPDGSKIVFSSNREDNKGLYRKNSSGAGNEEFLNALGNVNSEGTDWSRDGRYILFGTGTANTGSDLSVLPLYGDMKPYPVLQSEFNEFQGRFSPDGRWIAYVSNESGRLEVYVQSFPPAGGKWQISSGGGAQPHWRRDGKELYYISPDKRLIAVEVKTGATFEIGAQTPLFQTQVVSYELPNRYAASGDGQRFLINSAIEETSQTPITVILNWNSTLKKQP